MCLAHFFFYRYHPHRYPHSFPTRRSSDLVPPAVRVTEPRGARALDQAAAHVLEERDGHPLPDDDQVDLPVLVRSEEHTSELQSHSDLVCRLLLEKKKSRYDHLQQLCLAHQ